MIFNERKYTIYNPPGNEEHKALFTNSFPFEQKNVEDGLKYQGMPSSLTNMALQIGCG
jgi:hypothetical protein